MKNGSRAMTYAPACGTNLNENSKDESYYFVMNSILFLKGTANPWSRHVSRKTGYKYYYNPKTKETKYDIDRPPEAGASFNESFSKRLVWFWPASKDLTKDDLSDMVKAKCHPQ